VHVVGGTVFKGGKRRKGKGEEPRKKIGGKSQPRCFARGCKTGRPVTKNFSRTRKANKGTRDPLMCARGREDPKRGKEGEYSVGGKEKNRARALQSWQYVCLADVC